MGASADCFDSRESAASTPPFKRHVLGAALALLPCVSLSAPLVFEETARIASPDSTLQVFPVRMAVEGDTIIATGVKYSDSGENEEHRAFLFQRQSNGAWKYIRMLASTNCNSGEAGEDTCIASVAIRNGVAVVSAARVHVFERNASGSWIEASSDNYSGPGEARVGTGVVLTSQADGCDLNAEAMRKNAAGTWTQVMTFPGFSMPGCDNWGLYGEDVDISLGNRVIAADVWGTGTINIHEPSGSTWTQTATLIPPADSYFAGAVAIDDNRAMASGSYRAPVHVFNRSSGAWGSAIDIKTPDSLRTGSPGVMKVRDLVIAGLAGDPHRGGSVAVYRKNSSNVYEQVARLVASDSATQNRYLGWGDVDAYVNGSSARIVAGGDSSVYVFDLTRWGTTPAVQQENFEQGASRWVPMAGSTFSVVTSGESRVYRQSALTGDAGAFVTGIDWKNQAIEADIKPAAFDGSDRWFGLAVRRTDANNYYYATVRQSNTIELRRMKNGVFTTLASAPLSVVLNRNYRLRLEAVGTLVRAYVDGRLAVESHDAALTHGHAGVRMYKARADFDNVVLSQNPHLTLMEQRTPYIIDYQWDFALGDWLSDYPSGYPRFTQSSTMGDARAVSVVDAVDQIVQTRAKLNSFGAGSGSRWFGMITRYVDAQNYYYITVRRDNTISLRKMVNGTIQVLDTAPMTVTPGSTYTLRMEAVGGSLRGYVNGALLVEASDATHKTGRYGLATYSTAAAFQDLTAWEP